jgi:arsenite methyltransferase
MSHRMHSCLVLAAVLLASAPALSQVAPSAPAAHHLHDNPEAYIRALEDPQRDAWQKPHEVVQALELRAGEVVADIGAGSGYFTLRFASHVGSAGRIYAVDVSEPMISRITDRVKQAGLTNVQPVLAPPDDPKLPPAGVDLVFFCDVWHHIDDQAAYLKKLHAALRPGGEVVMIDFQKRDLPVGPPVSMKIAKEDLIAQMKEGAFRLVREHTFLPYQYFLVFSPA